MNLTKKQPARLAPLFFKKPLLRQRIQEGECGLRPDGRTRAQNKPGRGLDPAGSGVGSARGQVTVELILMLVVAAVLMQVSWNVIKDEGYLKAFVTLPNIALGNMISNGNWIVDLGDADKGKAKSQNRHPNRYGKRYSLEAK